MPVVLAAFLAHDFPLVDAVMLARAYRGASWPDYLFDYPVLVGCPTSRVAFAKFPNSVGHRADKYRLVGSDLRAWHRSWTGSNPLG